MKRSRTLLLCLAAVGAFIVSLIVLAPASLIGYFLPGSVSVGMWSGSIWSGSADDVVVGNRSLGSLDWKLRPLHLLRGRLALDAQLHSPDGNLSGWFSFGLGQSIQAQNVEARWPLAALPSRSIPPGWNADLQATLRKISFAGGALQEVLGVLDTRNLERGPPDAAALGSYRLTFDENSKQTDKLVGKLQDTDGPMQVNGTLTLAANREFTLEGQVAARPSASESITRTLRFLGAPDANGQRPFSVGGTY